MTLSTYAHVIAEFRGVGRIDPDALIAEARAAVERGDGVSQGPQEDPTKQIALFDMAAENEKPPAFRGLREEPTAGLEPATPSLRVKCSTS
jgi:hypothetical protein